MNIWGYFFYITEKEVNIIKDYGVFQEIVEYSKQNKLVFFVGAGVSALSKYPSWKELIDVFHEKLYGCKKDSYTSGEYLQLPQVFYDNNETDIYFNIINDVFNKNHHSNIVHDLLMVMNPKHILTTNYDNLLEESATKFGKNYSVINSDSKVASAVTGNYILKVHGDFETNNFVLKEDDYLNYSENFKLIDILMKTIMASSLIVFIGYGLGDYNINLILNWVKQVQGDTFIKPIFIYTGKKKLDNNLIEYYNKRGLRIIDSNEHIMTQNCEVPHEELESECEKKAAELKIYEEKYVSVLDKIINFKFESYLSSDKEKLLYFHSKLEGIENLPYIRYKDFIEVFDNDYYVDEDGYFSKNKQQADYIECFYQIKENMTEYQDLNKIVLNIDRILDKHHIKGITKNIIDEDAKYFFEDNVLENHYLRIEQYISNDYKTIPENYKKAYYYFVVGEVEKSYELYTELLDETQKNDDWVYYYYCQLNRNYVYKATKSMNSFFTGLNGYLYFGSIIPLFSTEILEKLDREMLNFRREELFNELPYEFRENVHFLKKLSSDNYYAQDFLELYDEKISFEKKADNSSMELGKTRYSIIKSNTLSTIDFTYKSMLLFSFFDEHKKYVRNAQILTIEKSYNEMVKSNEFDKYIYRQTEFELTYFDFINIAKNFKLEDIEYLDKKVDLRKFKYPDEEKVIKFIKRTLDYYIQNFSAEITGNKIIMYMWLKEEVKNIIYLSRYFISEINSLNYIFEFVLNTLPEREVDPGKKFIWSYKLLYGKCVDSKTIEMVEEYLVKHIIKLECGEAELSSNGWFSHNYVDILKNVDCNYISEKLSSMVFTLKAENEKQLDFFVSISEVLSKNSKDYIRGIYSIDCFKKLFAAYNYGIIYELSEYKSIMIGYLEEEYDWQKKNEESKKKVLTGSGKDIRKIGAWIALGLVEFGSEVDKYLHLNKEFHFLVSFEDFNNEDFNIDWLLNYSEELIDVLVTNNTRRKLILEKLENKITSKYRSRDSLYFNIYKRLKSD